MNREQQLAEAFVGLTDTLAEDFDPVVLLDRLARHCVEIVGAHDVGIMMATARGGLRTMAVSGESAALVEMFRLQSGQGPCLDCYRTGRPVDVADLGGIADRWPELVPLAVRAGYRAAHALPLRAGDRTIGAVNLLLAAPGGLPAADLRLAQALADVAALALIHYRADQAGTGDILTRVQSALAGKAAVEMATGMLAERGGLDLTRALHALQSYCRANGLRLTDTAQALVRRDLDANSVLSLLN
ncbi:GAF and ANTAR domain-containing protein [Streptomyces sp. NBC_01304]|uniref:GAF and ANTAR domain-containing protein n=1 Tax=Streptomyces sp. NBC_01304 TaxID=2903818 RepID=UPI002E11BBFA|nr:GAF domain-containing protein [Streptomyces sp. NBC_01304]